MLSSVVGGYGDFQSNGSEAMTGDFNLNGNGANNVTRIEGLAGLTVEAGPPGITLSGVAGGVAAFGDLDLNSAAANQVYIFGNTGGSITLEGTGVNVSDGVLRVVGGGLSLGGSSLVRAAAVSNPSGGLALACPDGSASQFSLQNGGFSVPLPNSNATMRIHRPTDALGNVGAPLLAFAQGNARFEFHPCSGDGFTTTANATSAVYANNVSTRFPVLQVDAVSDRDYTAGENVRWYATTINMLTLNPGEISFGKVVSLNNNRITNLPVPTQNTDLATRASLVQAWATVSAGTQTEGALTTLTLTSFPVGTVTNTDGIITVNQAGSYEVKLTMHASLNGSLDGNNALGQLRKVSDDSVVLATYEHTQSYDTLSDFSNSQTLVIMPIAQGESFYMTFVGSPVGFGFTLTANFIRMRT